MGVLVFHKHKKAGSVLAFFLTTPEIRKQIPEYPTRLQEIFDRNMEIIEQIEAWLKAPVYYDGVLLYERYGDSGLLKRMFAKSGDDYNQKKLHQELEALLEEALARQAELDDKTPPEVKDLKLKARTLMDERTALKERARGMIRQGVRDGQELKAIAHRLAFGIKGELDQAYGRLNFYERNGFLPEADTRGVITFADLIRRRNTLRTYLSRGTDQARLQEWRAELYEIENRLKDAATA